MISRADSEGAIESIRRALFNEIDAEKRRVAEEQREFYRIAGARSVLAALVEANALASHVQDLVCKWMKEGGVTHLTIDSVDIFPPREP